MPAIEIDSKLFAAALKRTALVAPKKASIEVLRRVRLHVAAWGRILRVSATDLDTFIEVCVPLPSAPALGIDVSVYPTELLAALKGLKGVVSFAVEDASLAKADAVIAGADACDVAGLSFVVDGTRRGGAWPGADFPAFPTLPAERHPVMLAPLLDAIERVVFAASCDAARPALNGVLVGSDTVVCTDGHRLASHPIGDVGLGTPVIVPARIAAKLAKLLAGETSAFVGLDPGVPVLSLIGDAVRLSVRCTDATFPDYRQVLPPEQHDGLRFSCSRDALLAILVPLEAGEKAACNRAADATSTEKATDAIRWTKLHVVADSGQVRVRGSCSGTVLAVPATAIVPRAVVLDATTEEPCALQPAPGFFVQALYLREAVKALPEGASIDIDQQNDLSPVHLTCAGGGLHIIMPMRP